MANPTINNSPSYVPTAGLPTNGLNSDTHTNYAYDTQVMHKHALCWKSIIGGVFVSGLTYSALMSLGLAFGGANLQGVINGPDTLKGLGIGAVVWIVASIVVSLAAGGYIAGRARARESLEGGRMQGLVVAGIFFMFVLAQFGSAVATVGKGAGMTVGAAGAAAGAVAADPRANEIMEDVIGESNLKSPPEVVARGLARRLVRGDTESATTYLAYQTGNTREQAQAKIEKARADITNAANEAGIAAAKAMKFAGWMLFTAIVSGAVAAFLFGGVGGEAERLHTTVLHTNRGVA